MHPHFAQFPDLLQVQLHHAHAFSQVMHGAALLYNLMLAEAADQQVPREKYLVQLTEWAHLLGQNGALLDWDRARFWSVVARGGVPISARTRVFVDQWVKLALRPDRPGEVADNRSARQLIATRERDLKGSLSPHRQRYRARPVERRSRHHAALLSMAGCCPVLTDILAGLAPQNGVSGA